ncbi:MAG: hypothetical protein R3F59_02640 [Myxococcota bacterium]
MSDGAEVKTELEVLIEQLDELLGSPIVEPDDALELATVAGLAARLGAGSDVLGDAIAWRDGDGRELLEEAWTLLDLEPLVEAVDACTGGGLSDDDVEEAVCDLDDIVAAAVWCGKRSAVKAAARRAAEIVREIPDPFAPLAQMAGLIAALPATAEDLGLYDYWLAVADARAAVGEA